MLDENLPEGLRDRRMHQYESKFKSVVEGDVVDLSRFINKYNKCSSFRDNLSSLQRRVKTTLKCCLRVGYKLHITADYQYTCTNFRVCAPYQGPISLGQAAYA